MRLQRRRRRFIRSGLIGGWTPAALFADGQNGLWAEASPTYKGDQVLWQQSDGTVIVDANGDPVGRDEDLSGNANHLTQATSADRPPYNTDGSLHWLAFDGAGDWMLSEFPQQDLIANSFILSIAARFVSGSGTDDDFLVSLANGSTSANWFGIRRDAGGTFAVRSTDSAGTSKTLTGPAFDTSKHIFTVIRNGSEVFEFFVDGVSYGIISLSGMLVSTLALNELYRAAADGFNALPVENYGSVFGVGVDISEREKIENYLASLAGITL